MRQATDKAFYDAFESMSSRALSELAVLNEVDYLLIAKPDATNHLKIRRDCV